MYFIKPSCFTTAPNNSLSFDPKQIPSIFDECNLDFPSTMMMMIMMTMMMAIDLLKGWSWIVGFSYFNCTFDTVYCTCLQPYLFSYTCLSSSSIDQFTNLWKDWFLMYLETRVKYVILWAKEQYEVHGWVTISHSLLWELMIYPCCRYLLFAHNAHIHALLMWEIFMFWKSSTWHHPKVMNPISQVSQYTIHWPDQNTSLLWRHNEHDGISDHQPYDCLPHRLFRRRSKKTKLHVTGLCVWNSLVTGEFPHKGPVRRKMFQLNDIIMIASQWVTPDVHLFAQCHHDGCWCPGASYIKQTIGERSVTHFSFISCSVFSK